MDKIPRISDELTPFFFLGLRRVAGGFFLFFLLIAEIIAHLESELNEGTSPSKPSYSRRKQKKLWKIFSSHSDTTHVPSHL